MASTCKHCGEVFEKRGQIGNHVANVHGSMARKREAASAALEAVYNSDPKRCRCCNEPIPYINRFEKTFCNHSCAAQFNNSLREVRPKKIPAAQRAAELLDSLIESWIAGETPAEFSVASGVTQGELKNAIKDQMKVILLTEQGNHCALCTQGPIWNEKPLTFILDHIDGNPRDHSKKNLRVVCPNCDIQLPTRGSKNRGNGRAAGRHRWTQQKERLSE